MKFSRVQIKNFRSIKDLTIHLDPRCRTLVGINESGKSNILSALSYLAKDKAPSKTDIRLERTDDPPIDEAVVRFIFSLEDSELDMALSNSQKQIFTLTSDNFILNNKDSSSPQTFAQYCRSRREGLYQVDFKNESRAPAYWAAPADLVIQGTWKKPTPNCPPDFVVSTSDGTNIKPKDYALVHLDGLPSLPTIPDTYLADATPADVNNVVGSEITKIVNDQLPSCLYWTYSDSNLLPSQTNMTQFAANPDSCLPLKNMFELAQIKNIGQTLNEKKAQPHILRNLLSRVAQITTNHIRAVWKEYQSIRVELTPNGDNVDALVSERPAMPEGVSTSFDFARRSDGFKRFVTFLLMVSAKVKSDALKNTLLLIDEPEIGLHPSGSKHLMNELIQISKNNYVVFSTHSISMIDKDNIGRHLIVEKKEEITTVRQAQTSNIVDEEVIFRAIGYSIFDTLNVRNVVFEGWRDKRLCQLALSDRLADDQALQAHFKDIGLCHATGVKDVRNIAAFLEMANRKCLIVSDDDAVAKENQRHHVKNHGYGVWKRYSEILPDLRAITGEDFVKPSAFRPILDKIKAANPALPNFSDADLSGPDGRLRAIDRWLAQAIGSKDDRDKIIDKIKEDVFADMKATDIEDAYLNLVRALANPEHWPG